MERGNESVITVAAMRAADSRTIESGTPSKELMRRAAQGIFDAYDGWAGKRTLAVCGSGNNGGDGYALAEILKDHACEVAVLRVSEKFSEDGRYYYDRCLEKGVPCFLYGQTAEEPDGSAAWSSSFGDYDILVDCMLGTGFAGTPKEPIATVIRDINAAHEAGAYVIAADINSGMNGDTGEAELAVRSDLTVSIGFYKKGLFAGRAPELIGRLVNVDIGIRLEEMTLYHMGFAEIREPDIRRGRRNADFGQGFYLSPDEAFSRRWATSREGMETILNRYTLVLDGLLIKRFQRDADWYAYLAGNRAGQPDSLAAYDVIIGPIANDTIYDTGGILTSGLLNSDQSLALLELGPVYEQVVIKSDKAAAQLTWEAVEVICEEAVRRARATVAEEEECFQEVLGAKMEELFDEAE